MDKKLEKSLNDQLNFELYSSYIYLSMQSYLKSLDLNGFANWMDVQVKEELTHVLKFYDFLHNRNAEVEFEAVSKPQHKWDSPLAVFEHALKHEKIVSKRINDLVDLATKVGDHATVNFLQWFVGEQVEEEANVVSVIRQIKLVGKSLFMLDRELGQRVFTPPATPQA
ncbi:MAG: ferritin [Victivallaceae bacterium]|nr:ferritin [Victivallaceae bacterium]